MPLAWACIAVLRYEGLLYFFADLSIVLGFPISFYGIATCLLGVFAAMRFYCCMPRRGDDAVVFFSLVGGSSGRGVSWQPFGYFRHFFFSCVGTKAPPAAEMPWGELGILGILP